MADEGAPDLNFTLGSEPSSQSHELNANQASTTDPNNPSSTSGGTRADGGVVSGNAFVMPVNPPRRYAFGFGWLSFTFYMLAYPTCKSVYDVIDWLMTQNAGGGLREVWNAGTMVVEEGYPTVQTNLGVVSMNLVSNSFFVVNFIYSIVPSGVGVFVRSDFTAVGFTLRVQSIVLRLSNKRREPVDAPRVRVFSSRF